MLVYKTFDKSVIYTKSDIEAAYAVCFGHRPNSAEYISFLNSIWGGGIRSAENMSWKDLVKSGYKPLATKCYRDEYNCTLTEAREKIEEYEVFLKLHKK